MWASGNSMQRPMSETRSSAHLPSKRWDFEVLNEESGKMKRLSVFASIVLVCSPTFAADAIMKLSAGSPQIPQVAGSVPVAMIKGPAVVVDGRTLWFPTFARRVRLANIDACELPQWAFDLRWKNGDTTKTRSPVPCGPFAKAWLKRIIGSTSVSCTVEDYDSDAIARARCSVRGRDVALEMLRVGWARVNTTDLADLQYLGYQHAAMSARYGMWGANVLDLNEWRRRAVDKSLDRQPVADFKLLARQRSKMSPSTSFARKQQNGQIDSD